MNTITKGLRLTTVVINNALQQQQARGYAVFKKLPVELVIPEMPTCTSKEKSGDGGVDWGVRPNDPILKLQKLKELEDADEIVKKLTSVEFHSISEQAKVEVEKAIKMVHRHNHDYTSMEAACARMTAKILQLQDRFEKFPNNKRVKVCLKELIEKRQKWLKKLRERDYACFEFLIDRLNLVFRPGFRSGEYERPFRKSSTKKLLHKYCDELRQKRLDEYRAQLEAEQKVFFKEKAEKLEFIRNEELACGVEPTVTEEEVEAAKQKAASLV